MEQQTASKKDKVFSIVAKIVAGVVVVALFAFYFYIENHNSKYLNGYAVTDGWTISYNGQQIYENVNLDSVELPKTKRGDVILYSRPALLENGMENSIMRLQSLHAATEVYINTQKVYSYGMDILEDGGFTGAGYHFIDFRSSSSSDVINIYFYVNDAKGFAKLKPPVLFNKLNALNNLITDRIAPLYCGVFLTVLGAVLLILTMFSFVFKNVPTVRLGFLAVFSLLAGIWVFYYSGSVQIFDFPISFSSTVENTAFFLLPIPILYYFIPQSENPKSILRKIHLCFFSVSILYTTIVLICHFKNILHFPAFLPYQHLIMFSTIALIICEKLIEARDKEKRLEAIVSICGISFILFGFLLDLATYYINKHFIALNTKNAQFASIGAVCFVLSIILSHLIFTNEKVKKSMERDMFRSFAYIDELTQVGNRHSAEELLTKLNEEQKAYTLFSIDLNDLKKTNDTWGHAEGDKMLKSFTKLLQSVFSSDSCKIARTGGDEFIVIEINDGTNIEPEDRITKLRLMMENHNNKSNGSKYRLSAAIGYVNSKDFSEKTPYELWNMADKLMYENKRKIKRSLNDEEGFWDMLPGR